MLDNEDYGKCCLIKWRIISARKNNYGIIGNYMGNSVKLANFIKNNFNIIYDHKDCNPFNNQKENLREATNSQNQANRLKWLDSSHSSKYKGVSYIKRVEKYTAQITVKYRKMHLGYFLKEKEAAIAYNKKAVELFGEFAQLNVVDG